MLYTQDEAVERHHAHMTHFKEYAEAEINEALVAHPWEPDMVLISMDQSLCVNLQKHAILGILEQRPDIRIGKMLIPGLGDWKTKFELHISILRVDAQEATS